MMFEEMINKALEVNAEDVDTNLISDGYHTFGELYEHRIVLYILTARLLTQSPHYKGKEVWKSKYHSDNTIYSGWFILGIGKKQGEQITYHLPMDYWADCAFAETLDKAPEFDGHTSKDVLNRLRNL